MDPNMIRTEWSKHLALEKTSVGDPNKGSELLKLRCRKLDGVQFHEGELKEGLSPIKKVKVFIDDDKTNFPIWSNCHIVSNYISAPKFGGNLIVGEDVKSLYVAYDDFDCQYELWVTYSSAKMTGRWWISQAQYMLKTLSVAARDRVYHGALAELGSYTVRGDAIGIINFGVNEVGKDMSAGDKGRVEKDMLDLKSFFQSQVKCRYYDLWDHFLHCFSSFRSWNQLRKHPVLLDGLEKYVYLRSLTYQVRNMKANEQTSFKNKLRYLGGQLFSNWASFTKGDVFYETLHYRGIIKVVTTQDAVTLFDFLENVLDHYEENAGRLMKPATSQVSVESAISTKYPMILAIIHQAAVKQNLEISGYYHS